MKRLTVVLLVIILAFTSCSTSAPDVTAYITTLADQTETETDTAAVETEEPAPADNLSFEAPVINESFTLTEAYKEPATENSGTKKVKAGDLKLTVE